VISFFKESPWSGHFWVLTAAALNVFVLYSPQPLLPFFAELYGLTESSSALLMAVTMLPLAIAPLSYGYLLSYIPAITVLRLSLILLAFLTFLVGMVQSFPQLLVVRFIQGLFIPAALTAVMAFLAGSGREGGLQKAMSLYVAATISGGFLGRLLAGISSVIVDWRVFYFALAVLLGGCFFMVRPADTGKQKDEKPLSAVVDISSFLKVRPCLPVYLAIFCLFFVFCGTLNFLPFRTVELVGYRSGLLTGIMYCGYITGIGTSMGAGKMIRQTGSEARVMIIGYVLFLLVLLAMLVPFTGLLFLLLFPFCGAMFLVHSVATAVVNRESGQHRGLASGFYVSSYYSGGVAGMYIPGLFYERYGWGTMVLGMAAVAMLGIVMLSVFFRSRVS
jgi:YNFM family putative membrane transporter